MLTPMKLPPNMKWTVPVCTFVMLITITFVIGEDAGRNTANVQAAISSNNFLENYGMIEKRLSTCAVPSNKMFIRPKGSDGREVSSQFDMFCYHGAVKQPLALYLCQYYNSLVESYYVQYCNDPSKEPMDTTSQYQQFVGTPHVTCATLVAAVVYTSTTGDKKPVFPSVNDCETICQQSVFCTNLAYAISIQQTANIPRGGDIPAAGAGTPGDDGSNGGNPEVVVSSADGESNGGNPEGEKDEGANSPSKDVPEGDVGEEQREETDEEVKNSISTKLNEDETPSAQDQDDEGNVVPPPNGISPADESSDVPLPNGVNPADDNNELPPPAAEIPGESNELPPSDNESNDNFAEEIPENGNQLNDEGGEGGNNLQTSTPAGKRTSPAANISLVGNKDSQEPSASDIDESYSSEDDSGFDNNNILDDSSDDEPENQGIFQEVVEADDLSDEQESKVEHQPQLPNEEIQQGKPNSQDTFQQEINRLEDEEASGHFLAYSLTAIILIMVTYILYHNKQKIVAIIIEGRNAPPGKRRRYNQNVSEAMPTLKSAKLAV